MREEYDFLTDETKDVFTDNVKAIAAGWDKCKQFIYGILDGTYKDPFAYFKAAYTAVCKAGVSTAVWDGELAYIHQKYDKKADTRCPHEAFQKKAHGYGQILETYLKAIADGHIDMEETDDLLALVAIEKPLIQSLETALVAHKLKLQADAEKGQFAKRRSA